MRPAFLLPLACLLAACTPEAEAPPPPEPLRLVQVHAVRPGEHAARLTLTGEVRARQGSNLAFQTAGRLAGWEVDTGARVAAGQRLARLDDRQQRAAHDGALAAQAAAAAQLEQARLQHERLTVLAGQGATTRSALDEAAAALRAAEAGLDRARAELAASARALADTELRAPVAGVITARLAEAGQILQAAQTVFALAEDGPRDAVFDVQEAALLALPDAPGIALHLLGDLAVRFAGRLHEVAPALDPQTGTVRVKVEILADAAALPLGAPIVMEAAGRSEPALVLPLPLPAMAAGGPAVWTVTPETGAEGVVRALPVAIRAYAGARLVLAPEALPEGALVVIGGPRGLREGQRVGYEVAP